MLSVRFVENDTNYNHNVLISANTVQYAFCVNVRSFSKLDSEIYITNGEFQGIKVFQTICTVISHFIRLWAQDCPDLRTVIISDMQYNLSVAFMCK